MGKGTQYSRRDVELTRDFQRMMDAPVIPKELFQNIGGIKLSAKDIKGVGLGCKKERH